MLQKTQTLLKEKARKKILSGVNKVYNAVKLTLGPSGVNAILPDLFNRGPRCTNDGVFITENILLADPFERQVADFFKETSKKTGSAVGDGTTTAAVIAGHLINKTFKQLPDSDIPEVGKPTSGNVMNIRKEILEAKDKVVAEIKKMAKPVKTLEELEKIAIVSVEIDEETAKIAAKMVWDLGRDTYIDVVDGYKGIVETEVLKGMKFPSKVAAKIFVNKPERREMVADDVKVLVTNYKLDNAVDVVQTVNSFKETKLAIFAPEFSDPVLMALLGGYKNGYFIYPIACPSLRTEQLEDLAIYTGATLIDKNTGKKFRNSIDLELGFAERIVAKDSDDREDTELTGGKGERTKRGEGNLVTERCDVLKKQLEEAKNEYDIQSLKRRIANLSSAIGVIRVGNITRAQGLYLKLKVEDGVFACKAALEEGYVEGGGLCLKKIAEKLPENVLTETLKEPYEQIQQNAGGLIITDNVIDPAKVVRLALEYAVSVASSLITTGILISEVPEDSPAEGYKAIAKAIGELVYFHAKERGMLRKSEEEVERENAQAFSRALMDDK